jgi:hypothetical protein
VILKNSLMHLKPLGSEDVLQRRSQLVPASSLKSVEPNLATENALAEQMVDRLLQSAQVSSLRMPCLNNLSEVHDLPSNDNQMKKRHLFGAHDFLNSLTPKMEVSPTNMTLYADLEVNWPEAVHRQRKRSGSGAFR